MNVDYNKHNIVKYLANNKDKEFKIASYDNEVICCINIGVSPINKITFLYLGQILIASNKIKNETIKFPNLAKQKITTGEFVKISIILIEKA